MFVYSTCFGIHDGFLLSFVLNKDAVEREVYVIGDHLKGF